MQHQISLPPQFIKHCDQCGKTFSTQRSLKNHLTKVHPKKSFKCYHCNHAAKTKYSLVRHMNVHLVTRNRANRFLCAMCSHHACDRKSMLRHYEEVHDVSLAPRKLEFKNFDEFLSWKSILQKTERCSYVAEGGPRKTVNKINRLFRCFRDGFYSSSGKGKRRLKVRGSCKINGICPSSITCSQDRHSGVVNVHYTVAHVGHETDVSRLKLTKDEKDAIARKIAANVPFDVIIDEFRELEFGYEVDHASLVTRKYLWNIKRDYNLNTDGAIHPNDRVRVESWVDQMKSDCNIVRFFKQQGTSPSHPHLKEDDFVLIFAMDTQLEMLAKHGHKCICLDSTHDANQYNFDLTTLFVLTDDHQGFPVAFLLSNRADHEIISIFAETLKAIIGDVETNVMMTDMTENFYNGWCSVMSVPKHRLHSSWHVDKAWRTNLSKVLSLEKKPTVYKMVKTLQNELDETAFQSMLESALHLMLNDPDTRNFGTYFKSEFEKMHESWAHCFRKRVGISTNMSLDALHEVIKHIYFSGKKVKRLDKALHGLVSLSRDKLLNIAIDKMRGKHTPKLVATRQRHDRAVAMASVITRSDSGFTISSESGLEVYEVKKEIFEKEGSSCSCGLECQECGICIHDFSCTCIDSVVSYNICEHIHKVSMFLKVQEQAQESSDPLDMTYLEVESTPILPPPVCSDLNSNQSDRQHHKDFDGKKEEIMEEFREIMEAASSDAHLDIIRQNIRPLLPMIEAVDTGRRFELSDSSEEINPCANVSSQKSFHPTKKPRKDKKSSVKKTNHERKKL